jgi:transposase-like protein
MDIKKIYKRFPTPGSCYQHLEQIRWNGVPICPYCRSKAATPIPKENRFRCNTCDTSYRVTVDTLFKRTRMDLQKWFLAIELVLNASAEYGVRQLGRDIEVTKDTAAMVLKKIKQAFVRDPEFLKQITNFNNR